VISTIAREFDAFCSIKQLENELLTTKSQRCLTKRQLRLTKRQRRMTKRQRRLTIEKFYFKIYVIVQRLSCDHTQ